MTRAGGIIDAHSGVREDYLEEEIDVLIPTTTGRDVDGMPYTEWRKETYSGRGQQTTEPQEDANAFGQQVVVTRTFQIDIDAPLKEPPDDAPVDSYDQPPRVRERGVEYEIVSATDDKTGRWAATGSRVEDRISEGDIL